MQAVKPLRGLFFKKTHALHQLPSHDVVDEQQVDKIKLVQPCHWNPESRDQLQLHFRLT